MANIVKEVEIAGVKHSITLADDMVGTGLKKDENGTVDINVPMVIPRGSSLMSGIVVDSGFGLCLDRSVIAKGLTGTGLEVEGGFLRVAMTGLAQDYMFLSGLAPSLVGAGLARFLVGAGLDIEDGNKIRISTGAAGSGINVDSGVISMNVQVTSGFTLDNYGLGFKIAQRSSGPRLFFNSKGELDVTID